MTYSDELYVFNADTLRFCWFNQHAMHTLGYSRKQLLAMHVTDIFPEISTGRVAQLLASLLIEQQSDVSVETQKNGNGYQLGRVMLHMELFSDQGSRYVHARVENLQARSEYQQQLLLTQFVMDNVSIAVYWLDQQGRIRYANHKASQALGYSQQALLSLDLDAIDFHHPLSQWQEQWQTLKRDGSLFFETLHQTKDGRVFPVKVLANYLRVGDIEYVVAFARDISETKQLEARLACLLAVIDVIVWSTNADWEIDYVSPQVYEILGVHAEVFIGRHLQNLFQSERLHQEDRGRLLAAFHILKKQGGSIKNLQYRIKNADGQWHWMVLSMSVVVDGKQCLQQVVGATHDINLQKQEEAHLLSLNAELDLRVQHELAKNKKTNLLLQQQARLVAMGEMIGNIAHQWRQPLNALAIILLNLEDALVHGETDAPYFRQALVRSQEILSDMSRTIDDFRGFLKNDKLLAETVLAEVINNSLRLVEATMANHQIKLVFTNPHCPIKGMVHSGELTQALLCLITNAKDQIIDRKIQNGEIRISIEPLADCSEIRIVDNAGGIAESNLQKIFDPYFTTKPDGIGLGLYISNLTIQKTMSGRIGVKNCNEGAQFSIFLPNIDVQEYLL